MKSQTSYYRGKLKNINRTVLETQYRTQHEGIMTSLDRYIQYAKDQTNRLANGYQIEVDEQYMSTGRNARVTG